MAKCPNCGACKECGAHPIQVQPYPYPVYPQPYRPWPTNPYTQPRPYYTTIGAGTALPPQAQGISGSYQVIN